MHKVVKSGSILLSEEPVILCGPQTVQEGNIISPEEMTITTEAELAAVRAEGEQLLREANAQAEQIVQQAQEKARGDYEMVLEQARREGERIRNEAYLQGRQDGIRAQIEEIFNTVSGLETSVARIEGEQAGFIAGYESDLRWLALEICTKVLSKAVDSDEMGIEPMIKAAVSSVKNAEWISVELSEQTAGLIDHLAQELKKNDLPRIEVRGIPAPAGTCVVDTPDGIIDASVYTQLENLKEYFSQQQ